MADMVDTALPEGAALAPALLGDAQQVRALIESHDYGGFGDLDHLKTLPSTNKARLHNKLLNTHLIEGVPFPASIAIVRAILGVDGQMGLRGDKDLRVEPEKLRFGVYHRQMTQVKEVGFGDFKAAFDRVRFHRDVLRAQLTNLKYLQGAIPGTTASLIEWHGYEFYSIPAAASDAMWDLFGIGSTTWASTDPANRQYEATDEIGERVLALSPVLVAAHRNNEAVDESARKGQRLSSVPMSQHGSSLHLLVFMGPRSPAPGVYQEMIWSHFNILGDEVLRPRAYAPEEAWIVAYYEPMPKILAVDMSRARYLGRDPGPASDDPWVKALPSAFGSAANLHEG